MAASTPSRAPPCTLASPSRNLRSRHSSPCAPNGSPSLHPASRWPRQRVPGTVTLASYLGATQGIPGADPPKPRPPRPRPDRPRRHRPATRTVPRPRHRRSRSRWDGVPPNASSTLDGTPLSLRTEPRARNEDHHRCMIFASPRAAHSWGAPLRLPPASAWLRPAYRRRPGDHRHLGRRLRQSCCATTSTFPSSSQKASPSSRTSATKTPASPSSTPSAACLVVRRRRYLPAGRPRPRGRAGRPAGNTGR